MYTKSTNSDGECIDEDDQKELVESLHREANIQSIFFQNIFCFGIGGLAILFSLTLPLLFPDECANNSSTYTAGASICCSHAVYSSLTHAWTIHPFILKTSQATAGVSKITTDVVGIVLQTIPIVLWLTGFFSQDKDHIHLALLIGNVVTIIGAHLIYWDIYSTRKAIKELYNARYKHKAL
mmetsp:Transcript_27033/g.30313  ORF Transcript_27033/g.30313 Transcript_27033/m.30313 type:complete len:181 (+) Transcript_27033:50-592(+)